MGNKVKHVKVGGGRDSRRDVISLVRVGKFELVRISGCPNWVRGSKSRCR